MERESAIATTWNDEGIEIPDWPERQGEIVSFHYGEYSILFTVTQKKHITNCMRILKMVYH